LAASSLIKLSQAPKGMDQMKEHYAQEMNTGSARRLFHAWFRGDDGVSAVEFALFAPILFFVLLATTDLGLALYQRMTIDHVLRSGAQSAILDPGTASVRKVLASTAAKNFVVSSACGASTGDELDVCVDRYFACPENAGVPVPSSTFCAGSQAPNIYYRLAGSKHYDGLFLPISIGRYELLDLTLASTAQVQIR
jgi:pilus assembly protein CpaE